MSQMTLAGNGLRGRVAKKSDDYVSKIMARRDGGQTLTHEAKVHKMALILSDEVNGIKRLGVGRVGPIQLKLRDQGNTRNRPVEGPDTPGHPHRGRAGGGPGPQLGVTSSRACWARGRVGGGGCASAGGKCSRGALAVGRWTRMPAVTSHHLAARRWASPTSTNTSPAKKFPRTYCTIRSTRGLSLC